MWKMAVIANTVMMYKKNNNNNAIYIAQIHAQQQMGSSSSSSYLHLINFVKTQSNTINEVIGVNRMVSVQTERFSPST